MTSTRDEDALLSALLFGRCDESAPFRAALAAANGKAPVTAIADYATYLRARADLRGEWLDLALALAEPRTPASERDAARARLAELDPDIPRAWRGLLTGVSGIFNCGAARTSPEPALRFAFECPRSWSSLAPTAVPAVRHCDACEEMVTWCDTRAEAERLARAGRCITLPGALAADIGRDVSKSITGRPVMVECWARKLFPPEP